MSEVMAGEAETCDSGRLILYLMTWIPTEERVKKPKHNSLEKLVRTIGPQPKGVHLIGYSWRMCCQRPSGDATVFFRRGSIFTPWGCLFESFDL